MNKEIEYEVINLDRNDTLLDEIAADTPVEKKKELYSKVIDNVYQQMKHKKEEIDLMKDEISSRFDNERKTYLKTDNKSKLSGVDKKAVSAFKDYMKSEIPEAKIDKDFSIVQTIEQFAEWKIVPLYADSIASKLANGNEEHKEIYKKAYFECIGMERRKCAQINQKGSERSKTRNIWTTIGGSVGLGAVVAVKLFTPLVIIGAPLIGAAIGTFYGLYRHKRNIEKAFDEEFDIMKNESIDELVKAE